MSKRALLALGLAGTAALTGRPLGSGGLDVGPAEPTARPAPPAEAQAHPAPRRHGAAGTIPGGPWRWPLVPRPDLLRPFDAPPTPYGPGHRGLDLRSGPAAQVRAVAAGRVTHAGVVAGRGTVTVAHPGGLSSTYEPVLAGVARGDAVAAGALLGTVEDNVPGTPHCGATACLHLGARRGPGYVDPLPLLVGGRAVLLPLWGPASGAAPR